MVDLPEEPLGAARDGDAVVILLNGGGTMRGAGTSWRAAGSFAGVVPLEVYHHVGLFTGADGRARIVGRDRPMFCVAPAGLAPCGPVLRAERPSSYGHSIWPARVFDLTDGLVVHDQSARAQLVDEEGAREIPWLSGAIAYAGPVSAPWALRRQEGRYDVLRLVSGSWEAVAAVPRELLPQAIATGASGSPLLGCEDGVVVELVR